jgi:microcompartment protein CcmK/EutM
MVMGEQKLLKAARGPVVHQVRNTGIQQGDRIVEFDHRAAGATAIVLLQARPAARRAVAAKDRHQLGATGAG